MCGCTGKPLDWNILEDIGVLFGKDAEKKARAQNQEEDT